MSNGDRTYDMNDIRKKRDETARQLALMQRELDAYQKMTDAAEEIEAIKRERASAEVSALPVVPAAEPASQPPPGKTGDNARQILQEYTPERRRPRQVHREMVGRGWIGDSPGEYDSVRAALRRLAERDVHVDRLEDGLTYGYRWMDDNGQSAAGQLALSNGSAHRPTGDDDQ